VRAVREHPPTDDEQRRAHELIDQYLDAVHAQVPAPLEDDDAWEPWLGRVALPYLLRRIAELPAEEGDLLTRVLMTDGLLAWHQEAWGTEAGD
jgi:hypothetical protein